MARENRTVRYSSVAVSLHWLIAIFILGLVVVAKVSHSLDTDDPLRFTLIQWHKSFGIAVLLLVLVRIIWRLTHKPPALPEHMGMLERLAASLGHLGLYGLMLAMPLTGWALVSASPLNLATELFGLIPWPHIPWLENIADKDVWEYRFSTAHYWLANGLIALVVVHALAAFRHQFWLRDGLLSRMTIAGADQTSGLFFGALIGIAGVLGLIGLTDRQTGAAGVVTSQAAAENASAVALSEVGFSATQLGEQITGLFTEHEISLQLDDNQLSSAVLSASVNTSSVSSGDSQIDSTVVTREWFASAEYPVASFTSISISKIADAEFEVVGQLTIRDVTQEVTFPMQQSASVFSGEVVIDRRDFGVGVGGQDEFVGPEVTINFSFEQQ